jgi:tetratricopeptide (TPR) repeat protein
MRSRESAIVNLAARLAESWYLLRARLALLTGRREGARTALKRALGRNPGSFAAHFLLARVYWRDHAVAKAKREFDLSWQIDPERFERAYAHLRVREESVPELFSYAADPVEEASNFGLEPSDDFGSPEERRRLLSLPPITREEIGQIDWDRFQDEIYRDSDV